MSCVALIFFLFVIVMFFSRIAMPRNNTLHCLFNCSIVFLSLLSTSFLFFATPAYRLAICLKILYCNMSAYHWKSKLITGVYILTIFDACREVANILNLGSLTIYREPGCTLLPHFKKSKNVGYAS